MWVDPSDTVPVAVRRAARLLLALLYASLALGLGVLLSRSMGVWSAWQTRAAQVGVAQRVLEDSVTTDDPVRGWKHVPGRSVQMPDLGPQVVWQINGQGLRGPRDYALNIPAGRRRVVALGDSFTFGNVAWEDTWPAALERVLPDSEVLNMGASGYGVDQMYLWYRDEGVRFDTDDVVLALIDDDLRRATLTRWSSGHGRPVFRLVDGVLQLTNVPIAPRKPTSAPSAGPLDFLRFYATWVVQGPVSDAAAVDPAKADAAVPLAVVDAIADLVHARGDRLTVVMLPIAGSAGSSWRSALEPGAAAHHYDVFDLTQDFLDAQVGGPRQVSPEWYLPDGHFNAKGNAKLASIVAARLRSTGSKSATRPDVPSTLSE